ncbi:MAG: hypothetical protein HQM08_08830 [Candidatus Riflebacteria bacterium]|nr:hypothetical protein [Candidatus Riflebacteria bacterium]
MSNPSKREKKNILLVGKSGLYEREIEKVLAADEVSIKVAADENVAIEILKTQKFDILVAKASLLLQGAPKFIFLLKNDFPEVEVLCLASLAEYKEAELAIKEGAYESLTEPINPSQLKVLFLKTVEHQGLVHGIKAGGLVNEKKGILSRIEELKKLLAEIEHDRQQIKDLRGENEQLRWENGKLKEEIGTSKAELSAMTKKLQEAEEKYESVLKVVNEIEQAL